MRLWISMLVPALAACSLVRDLDDLVGDPPSEGCPTAAPPGLVQTELASSSAPFQVPRPFLGMHVSPNDPDTGAAIPPPNYAYGYLRNIKISSGSTLVERGFWQNIELSESAEGAPGDFDWTSIDAWMAANPDHPVIWVIYGTPTFYQKYADQNDEYWGGNLPRGMHNPPADDRHYALARYAQAVKARYGTRIAAFEVWDEPTLSYGDAGNYSRRCEPSIVDPQVCPEERRFSGSASDLANIAYTLNHAGLGVPILGAGFADQWGAGQHSVSRFLDAPVTLPGGSGTGKDNIQALSVHFFDYTSDPTKLIAQLDGYKAKLVSAGVGALPIWVTASGAAADGSFSENDPRAPSHIKRWLMIGAAKGVQSYVLYAHAQPDTAIRTLGDPVYAPAVQSAIQEGAALAGKTICDARLLTDGRVWLVTQEDGAVVE